MARIIIHKHLGPGLVKTKSGEEVWICRCGLTKDPNGECDKSHKRARVVDEEPGKVYVYDEELNRKEFSS